MGNSLCSGHEEHAVRETDVQIENPDSCKILHLKLQNVPY
jgi:hypothetical protein